VRLYAGALQPLQLALLAHTRPGDGVLVHLPEYDGFGPAIEGCGRRVVTAPLARAGDRYRLDAEATRAALGPDVRALVLSSPHNPTGHVFDADELAALAALAEERDLLVISDEVHADVVHAGHVHRPLASLGPAQAARTVTLLSPAKAFAIPGLGGAAAVYGSPALCARADAVPQRLLGAPGALALEAMAEAWSGSCDGWLDAVLAQLAERRERVAAFASAAPGVALAPPEGTFLAWLDVRGLGLGADAAGFFLRRARVSLRDGADYGAPGFVRLNFATTAANLGEILGRMAGALPAARAAGR
jgi:cystathionine beta-lyase